MPPLRFIKAHAYGNDFLLLPASSLTTPLGVASPLPELARRVCDRHRGAGADGVMLLVETPAGATTRLLNADGSRSELSGNGVRTVAAWLAHQRRLAPGAVLTIDTEAGAKTLELIEVAGMRTTFRAAMGPPEDVRELDLDVAGETVRVGVLRVGNPQCVALGPSSSLTEERLHRVAAALAVHPTFPEGTNVELATVESPGRVRILIWERGVGPTEASGTGACGAAVVAAAFGRASRDVQVVAPGGTQRVEWTDEGLFLTGSAELVGAFEWWGQP